MTSKAWLVSIGLCLVPILSAQAEQSELKSQIQISSPSNKQAIKGIFPIQVAASAPDGIAQVTVSRDDAFLEMVPSAPYEIRWDTHREADGPHTVIARAQSSQGKWLTSPPITVIVDNTPPEIRIKSPAAESLLTGVTTLEAEASDNIALSKIQFYAGNILLGTVQQPPYVLSWDLTDHHNGLYSLKGVAFDQAGNRTESHSVAIRISNPNQAPVLQPVDPLQIKEGSLVSFTLRGIDPDGARDPLTYKILNAPSWISMHEQTGEVTLNPTYDLASVDQPETYLELNCQVCDPEPLCAKQKIGISVVNVNRPPKFTHLPEQKVAEGEPFSLEVPPGTDPDGDELIFTVKGLPAWLKFDSATRLFSGTPGFEIASKGEETTQYNIQVKACDPEPLCDTTYFKLSVLNTDRPPLIAPLTDRSIEEGKILTFDVEAQDPDGDPLTLSADSLPEGATFKDYGSGKGTFAWRTDIYQGGRYLLNFTAQEKNGTLSESEQVAITLKENNLTISGYIKDEDGKPVPDIQVFLETASESNRYDTTGTDGFYMIDDLAPGTYILRPHLYMNKQEFSSQERTGLAGLQFDPISRKVTIDQNDQREINFTAYPME